MGNVGGGDHGGGGGVVDHRDGRPLRHAYSYDTCEYVPSDYRTY